MEWIRSNRSALTADIDWPRIHSTDASVNGATRDRHRARVLLRTVDPVGKSIIGDHVIELSGGLVVPTAPRLGSVDTDDDSLIGSQNHSLRIVWCDPHGMIVVTTWSTLDWYKRFATIG